ncbi:uncharacterized protein LOC106175041 [Lingula anatina]|uniref:Uncharacterized protein LOC106175041 n=1 Tax=Lingula anatina TaxID=7574 RepID=A0A1S3JQ74_LINAN|nr:uncharacterized protein LOC106175041 [Lingula anatina]XP_013412307.1 uncharacterized protein LOC106175041 [Lingula anatina]|eukprot:XP_013412306.1 uncharacterized protein LOC106175041 [Lingula anatina]
MVKKKPVKKKPEKVGRAPRKKSTKPQEKMLSYDKLWTIYEKKKLLTALKVCSIDDYAEMHKLIPTRSEEEIKWYIDAIRIRASAPAETLKNKIMAPIAVWLRVAENLVSYDQDHSYDLAKVMSIAGNLEPHRLPKSRYDPNYQEIYSYIVAALKGEDPPDLSPLDSAVVLDLLQNLAGVLKESDLEEQRELMKQKYELLHLRVDIHDRKKTCDATWKAMDDDELLKSKQTETGSSNAPVPGTSGTQHTLSADNNPVPDSSQSNSQQIVNDQITMSNGKDSNDVPPVPIPEKRKRGRPPKKSRVRRDRSTTVVVDSTFIPHMKRTQDDSNAQDFPSQSPLFSLNPFNIAPHHLRPKKKVIEGGDEGE